MLSRNSLHTKKTFLNLLPGKLAVAKRFQIDGIPDGGWITLCFIQFGVVGISVRPGHVSQFLQHVTDQVRFNVGEKGAALLDEEMAQVIDQLLASVRHLRSARLQHVAVHDGHDVDPLPDVDNNSRRGIVRQHAQHGLVGQIDRLKTKIVE